MEMQSKSVRTSASVYNNVLAQIVNTIANGMQKFPIKRLELRSEKFTKQYIVWYDSLTFCKKFGETAAIAMSRSVVFIQILEY